jgi:hypothetical protein
VKRELAKLITGQIFLHACMTGMRMATPLLALQQGYSTMAVGVLLAPFSRSRKSSWPFRRADSQIGMALKLTGANRCGHGLLGRRAGRHLAHFSCSLHRRPCHWRRHGHHGHCFAKARRPHFSRCQPAERDIQLVGHRPRSSLISWAHFLRA